MRFAASFFALLSFVTYATGAAYAADTPAAGALPSASASPIPSSSPSAAPKSGRCELADPAQSGVTLIDSFAHPIHDRATLRFLFLLENEPQRAQRAIFARTAQSFDPALIELLRSQVAKACAGTEISSRAVRALSLVSDRWDGWTVRNADFSGFAAHVLVSVAALAVADQVPPEAVEQALAPFDTTFEKLSQPAVTPAPLPSQCPANREARVLIPTRPEYSAMARADHVSGVFATKMTLDDEGLVESVELLADPEGGGAEVNSLRASTVVAAGSSTFAPGIADCRAVGGTYVFKATFRS